MTVARLRAEVPQVEYVRWSVYYGRIHQRAELDALKAKAARG